MRSQFETVIALINHSWKTLTDLDLSWCNLDYKCFHELYQCLKSAAIFDSQIYAQNCMNGTLRSLNLSYNPFLVPNQLKQMRNEQMSMLGKYSYSQGEKEMPDDVNNSDYSSSSDEPANQKEPENFTQALLMLIKGHCLRKCTHLNISGIQAISSKNLIELAGELIEYQNCQNLLSVHLSDLGINQDAKLKEEIKDHFQFQE